MLHAGLSLPSGHGAMYATSAAIAHEPSGKQAFEPRHSACEVHPRQLSPTPHTGFAPPHADACDAVHCTQMFEESSQMLVGAKHCALLVQKRGPTVASSRQLLS